MTHEIPFPGIQKDPPPPIPENPVLGKGVTHIVTHLPDGRGWRDVISVANKRSVIRWHRNPLNKPIKVSDDGDWKRKIREQGKKAKRLP